MTSIPLDTLQPGERFAVAGLDKRGTVVRVGAGSVTVRYDGLTQVEVGGKKFNRPNAPITIAPRTAVIPLFD